MVIPLRAKRLFLVQVQCTYAFVSAYCSSLYSYRIGQFCFLVSLDIHLHPHDVCFALFRQHRSGGAPEQADSRRHSLCWGSATTGLPLTCSAIAACRRQKRRHAILVVVDHRISRLPLLESLSRGYCVSLFSW